MCFLPPNCIFCKHYNHEQSGADRDCSAFSEIPEKILFGGYSHTESYPGDNGVLFELNPDKTEEYADYLDMRNSVLAEQVCV